MRLFYLRREGGYLMNWHPEEIQRVIDACNAVAKARNAWLSVGQNGAVRNHIELRSSLITYRTDIKILRGVLEQYTGRATAREAHEAFLQADEALMEIAKSALVAIGEGLSK